MSSGIEAIVMPKWGLAMQEGMVASWSVKEGDTVTKGQEICDIETSKIANAFECPVSGKIRRLVAAEGENLPVAYLIAVVADDAVDDAAIDGFIDDFKANFVVEDTGDSGPDFQMAETACGRIRYLVSGDGDGVPAVFIHGFGGDLMGWMLNQDAAAQGRKAYAIDLPGHGGSTKDVGAGDIAHLSETVLNFLQVQNIQQAHLIGHSLGGAVAVDLVRSQPARVASATLLAPAGLGPEISMDYIEGFMREKRSKKLRPYLEMLSADPALISKELVEEVLKFKRLDGVDQAMRKLADNCFGGGSQSLIMKSDLASASLPVTIVWGQDDKILPPAHADGLPSSIKVKRLPDCGHLPQMEKTEEVNKAIEEMLTSAK